MRISFSRLVLFAIALALTPSRSPAQGPLTLSGRVTTEGGVPIGYAEVVIPTLGLGATTRDDGRYAIVIPGARAAAGNTIAVVARRLGYKPVTAQITLAPGIVEHDFVLAPNPLQLGEVVITGAGTVTEAQKLGSVRNTVDSTVVRNSNESNIVQALAGKAPNVEVTQQSGDPGASSFIRIRGTRTISGSGQPLFVVDGVPLDNSSFSTSNFNLNDDLGAGQTDGTVHENRASDLNPNDIESVEILKGAAAGAIYGARAGQGVILITTKSGRAGPTRFSWRSSLSVDDINHKYPLQTIYGEGISGAAPDTTRGGDCDNPSSGSICSRSWGPALVPGSPVFDHANEAYEAGHVVENDLTISGGNDRTTFYLSAGQYHNNGIFVGDNDAYSRVSVRVRGSQRLADNLKVGANFSFADTRGSFIQRGNNVNGIQLSLLRSPPNFNNLPYLDPTYGLHRTYRFQHPGPGDLVADRGFDNPFFIINEQQNRSKVGRMFGNINAEYVASTWLRVNYTLGADYSNDERLEGCPISSSDVCFAGRVIEGKLVNYQVDHSLTATVNYHVNDNLGGTVTLGQNLNARNFRQLGNVGRTLITSQPFKVSNTVSRDIPSDAQTVVHNAGYFAQATLDLYGQVYLTGALRNDGSSTFGRQNRRSWFPKASLAWTFTKVTGERPWLTFGKYRLAYGEAGQEPQPYLTSTNFLSNTIVSGISQGTGETPTQNGFGGLVQGTVKGADALRPERTKEFETGFDIGLFRDKSDLSVTYYNARTEDVILLTPVSAAGTGFTLQASNSATFRNRGLEMTLNVRPLQRQDYGWDVGFQWARNRSLVMSLGGANYVTIGDFQPNVAMVGQELGVLRSLGFYRCGLSAAGVVPAFDAACAGAPNGALFIDASGFPVADPDPRVIANPNPRWTGSVRSSFRFRKLQFSGFIDIRHGGQIWNGTKGALWSYGTHQETASRGTVRTFGQGGWYDGPVVGPGAGTAVPIGQNWYRDGDAPCPFTLIDEPCIEDGGFVKLRELSVTYTLDAPWVQRSIGVSSIDIRVSGRNLHTWTKYTGYDPETSLGGAIAPVTGIDYFNNPQTRSFVFSFTLNR
ncbi:MAG TPA: SusC/RagA family TonB-linked outer membrane protein [Gemmatimonadales bacterium]|nr:SusC/RagA family TonB-linked outer membrane protein [Gemmatimonadales bacterium]